MVVEADPLEVEADACIALDNAELCELTVPPLLEEHVDGASGHDTPVRGGCGSRVRNRTICMGRD